MFDEHCYYCKRFAIYATWCHDPEIKGDHSGPCWVELCGHHQWQPQGIVSSIRIPGRCACHGMGPHERGL